MEGYSHGLGRTCQEGLVGERTHEDSENLAVITAFFDHLVALVDTLLLTGWLVDPSKGQVEINSHLVDTCSEGSRVLY